MNVNAGQAQIQQSNQEMFQVIQQVFRILNTEFQYLPKLIDYPNSVLYFSGKSFDDWRTGPYDRQIGTNREKYFGRSIHIPARRADSSAENQPTARSTAQREPENPITQNRVSTGKCHTISQCKICNSHASFLSGQWKNRRYESHRPAGSVKQSVNSFSFC